MTRKKIRKNGKPSRKITVPPAGPGSGHQDGKSAHSLGRLRGMVRPYHVILAVLFLVFIILRFFEPENRAVFGWDQVVNSWVIKDMILAGKRPLIGMVAKGNTGFYIGPAYYYLLAPFYYVFRLDPVANQVFAGTVSCITFVILYLVTRKMLDNNTAVISVLIYTFSSSVLSFDRVAWPVNFIPMTSLLVLYFLYRTLQGGYTFLIPLAAVIGFSFHTHFTAIYYVVIVLCCTPLILKSRQGWKYSVLALPFFLVWLVPNFISEMNKGFSSSQNMAYYLKTFYHGLHLTRVLQLTNDAFIEFESVLFFRWLKFLNLVLPAVFAVLLWLSGMAERMKLIFLFILWFFIPWLVMSMYAGEISNYYFSITRPVAVMVIGYVISRTVALKNKLPAVLLLAFFVYYGYANIIHFLDNSESDLPKNREEAKKALREDKKIEFVEWEARSYLYEVYKNVYKYKGEPKK